MATFSKVLERTKLKPRRDPYWPKLRAGCYLGYRKMTASSDGNWSARFLDESKSPPKQAYKALGDFVDLPDHQRHDAAKKAAEEWFDHVGKGGASEPITVKEAWDRYIAKLKTAGKADAAADITRRYNRWIKPDVKLAATPILKLTAGQVNDWRVKLAETPAIPQNKKLISTKPRSASALNRDMAVFKTVLNLALEDGYATSDAPWRTKLKPVKNATKRRDCYLDLSQRRALIDNAQKDLAPLLRAMSLIPLRPGAVAALTVGSFDKRLGVLTVGKDKSGQDRKITLPSATAAFFTEQAKDKLPASPLFARFEGKEWNKDSWKYPFKDALVAAKLPANATAYTLRHSTITDLIAMHRLDTMTVAVLSGTSIAMIEKHYGHLLREHAAKALASLTL